MGSILTDLAIRNAKPKAKKYKLSAGRGLTLVVMPHGAQYWRLRYRFAGRAKEISLGQPYPELSLKAPRPIPAPQPHPGRRSPAARHRTARGKRMMTHTSSLNGISHASPTRRSATAGEGLPLSSRSRTSRQKSPCVRAKTEAAPPSGQYQTVSPGSQGRSRQAATLTIPKPTSIQAV